MLASFTTNLLDLRNRMVHINGTVHELVGIISDKLPLGRTTNTHQTNSSALSLNPLKQKLLIRIPPWPVPPTISAPAVQSPADPSHQSTTITSTRPFPLPAHCSAHDNSSSPDGNSIMQPPSTIMPSSGHIKPEVTGSRARAPSASGPSGTASHCRASSHSLPMAGLVIPDIPVRNPDGSCHPRSDSWQDIIQHWMEGAPELGLHTPLRDWLPEWTQGANWLFAAKYHQWSIIALEFLST